MDSTAYEMITLVDSFYSSAWNKLIVAGGIVLIVFPILIHWLQSRSLALSKKDILLDIRKELELMKKEVKESIADENQLKFREIEEKLQLGKVRVSASIFHLQGNSQFQQSNFKQASISHLSSAQDYIKLNDLANVLSVLGVFKNGCLPRLTLHEIEEIEVTLSMKIEEVLNEISHLDKSGATTRIIQEIKSEIHNKKIKPKSI